ncbi:MAG: hypothetical protein V1770_02955 [bacterium]
MYTQKYAPPQSLAEDCGEHAMEKERAGVRFSPRSPRYLDSAVPIQHTPNNLQAISPHPYTLKNALLTHG